MYRSDLNSRDRGGAVAAVVAIHAALLFAFLHLSGRMNIPDPQSVLQIIDMTRFQPPPPPPPPRQASRAKPKDREGGSSPQNIKSEATPVVAPKPRIVTPPIQPIVASETPRQGTQTTQGASDVRGQERGPAGPAPAREAGQAGQDAVAAVTAALLNPRAS